MMNKNLLMLLLCSFAINAQNVLKQNKHWHFGYKAHFDFGNLYTDTPNQNDLKYVVPPAVTWGLDGGIYSGSFSCASVSDLNGNFLFSSDGSKLYKIQNYQISPTIWAQRTVNFFSFNTGNMGISGNTIIVPRPKNSNYYYVMSNFEGGLDYFQVKANNQLDVQVDNTFTRVNLLDDLGQPINQDTHSRKITSVRHQNGVDYWLIAQVRLNSNDSNLYRDMVYAYLVTCNGVVDQNGVANMPWSVLTLSKSEHFSTYVGATLKTSHANVYDNNNIPPVIRFALTYSVDAPAIEGARVGSFNRATGEMIFSSTINLLSSFIMNDRVNALEFSPDGNVLYLADYSKVYQVNLQNNVITPQSINLTQANLTAEMTEADFSQEGYDYNPISWISDLQIGPNNKLYVNIWGKKHLGEILNPNTIGSASYSEIPILLIPLNAHNAYSNAYTQWYLPQLVQQQIPVPKTIVANNDSFSAANNNCVETTVSSILANDTVNGTAISNPSSVVIKYLGSVPALNNGAVIINSDGTVTIAPGIPAGTYVISYQVCELGSCPVCSNVATITITIPNGPGNPTSKRINLIDDIKVYPNPSEDVFNVEGNFEGEIRLYNFLGQLIETQIKDINSKLQINLSGQPNGIYMLKYNDGKVEQCKSIIKK